MEVTTDLESNKDIKYADKHDQIRESSLDMKIESSNNVKSPPSSRQMESYNMNFNRQRKSTANNYSVSPDLKNIKIKK